MELRLSDLKIKQRVSLGDLKIAVRTFTGRFKELSVTDNGEYNASDEGLHGYSKVMVDVPRRNFDKYHITQVLNEDGTIDLEITDYAGQDDDNYLIGEIESGKDIEGSDTISLHIVNE